ncbi:hypothetical protein PFISCL1PPCAC_12687, partial [Pristionchus fissidentatus]
ERIREERFDAAFTERIDWCSVGQAFRLNTYRFAEAESFAQKDGLYPVSHMDINLAYVPTIMGGRFGEDMAFAQRAFNLINYLVYKLFVCHAVDGYNEMFNAFQPGFPDLLELMARNSLYFLNSDPLIDFLQQHELSISEASPYPINDFSRSLIQTWSNILELRRHTALMSFCTLAKTHSMPEEYKET